MVKEKMSANSDGGSVQVISKVGALLNLLAEHQELSVSELVALSGEPRTSIYRLMGSLVDLEFAEPGTQRGTFRLGLGLVRLGTAVIERFNIRQAAFPAMEALHQATGETVNLIVRRGMQAVCIERLNGERVQELILNIGGILPLHVGAAPLTLLAYENKAFQDEYIESSDLQMILPPKRWQPQELRQRLEAIRREGASISDEDITPGIAAVGAPVFGLDGSIQGAISLSGTKPMIVGEMLSRSIELVRVAALDTSHALGFDVNSKRTRSSNGK